jgi:aspartate aminotransferase-like enzyme
MRAMQGPIINHRGDAFRELSKGLLDKTKRLFQTEGDAVIFSSSGTGGVEAAILNLVRPGDVALVPVFGEFSGRLAETIEMVGGKAVRVASEIGNAPSLERLKESMDSLGSFNSLFLVHNETSTGVAAPYIQEAAKLASDRGAFVVIDAISSLGGYAIPVDRWGVDACVTGSQKCLAAPPGLALLSVSQRVVEFLRKSPPKTRYFDILRYLEYGERGETPFTPALPLYYALDEAMNELLEEGLGKRVERHDDMSDLLYKGLAGLGLKPVAEKSVRSKTVIASYYPQGVDDSRFRKTLALDKGVVIAGGFGSFAGKVFRVGCMGNINKTFVETTLKAIGETLSSSPNR